MTTAPLPTNEASRLAAIRDYDLLSGSTEPGLDDLTSLAAQVCGTPISLVSLVLEEKQWFKSRFGTRLTEIPRGVSFCAHAILQSDLFIVPNAAEDERFMDNPLVTGEPGIRFYAAAPLRTASGEALGTLCIMDRQPRTLSPAQGDALRALGRQVMSQLELQRHARHLAASEERLAYALDATLDGLWDWDISSGQVYFSPQWARLLGFSPEEILPRVEFFYSILHPDDHDSVRTAMEAHFAGRIPVKQGEVRLRTKSGEFRWFLDRGKVVVRDAEGEPLRMVGTITDITERKKTEAALQESEHELRLITNRVPGPVSRVDRELRYRFVNDHYLRSFGRSRSEIIGRHMPEILGPEMFRRLEPHVRRVLAGEAVVFENQIRLPSGEERFAIVHFVPDVDVWQKVVGFFVIAFDITERREAERDLRISHAALKSISQGVMIARADGVILSINQAFANLTGYTAADLIGKDRRFLTEQLTDPLAIDRIRVTQQTGTEFHGEVMDRRKDGSSFWNELTITPVRDEQGEVSHFIRVTRDITKRRSLEEQLSQSQKMEAIGQLAGGVAHDFNNILAAILGNTEISLTELPPSHPVRENLAGIKAASLRAKSLIQQILTFSRQQPPNREVISLESVVRESAHFLRATIPATIELVVAVDPNVPAVLADSTQIHQVLVNLGTNAWHAIGDQPGCIEIRLQSLEVGESDADSLEGCRPGRFACLSVRDTGKGMQPETLRRIFDPFFTTKQPGEGTGLGLSVVHGIVQAHDGFISVVSRPGRGTTFKVLLPVGSTAETANPPTNNPPQRGTGARVMFIDDETSLVVLGKRMLEHLGYQVTCFTSPSEAVEAFRQTPSQFDAVITDLNMPGMSGFQTAAKLQEISPPIPILLCSGRITEDLRQRAKAAGIRETLHKPNTLEEFSQALHRAIRSP